MGRLIVGKNINEEKREGKRGGGRGEGRTSPVMWI